MDRWSLPDIVRARSDQASFHVASEQNLRVEFMRFKRGQRLGPVTYGGDILVTCVDGTFTIGDSGETLEALTQAVIPSGSTLVMDCTAETGWLQIVWTPPFARVVQTSSGTTMSEGLRGIDGADGETR